MDAMPTPVNLGLSRVKFDNRVWATQESIVEQQWDRRVPIVAQQWYLGIHSSNDLKALLEDTDVQEWFGIILVQDN
jgi:hypothetical protein